MSDAHDAATVILLRDGRDGLETLLLRRNSKIAFGGMWVFPGGKVDACDRGEIDDAVVTARNAAVREVHEEAGIRLAADHLVPLSHWSPPLMAPKRFLTWFFVAAAPADAVQIDHGEIHEHAWLRPSDALARRNALEIDLAPPTWVTLEWLATHLDVAAALTRARATEPERFVTRILTTADGPVAVWNGDAAYTADGDQPGARHRLSMFASGWRYERRG